MKYTKTILYIGEDVEFIEEIKIFFKTHDPQVRLINTKYQKCSIVRTFSQHPSHVIVVDFTSIDSLDSLLEEVGYLKGIDATSGVLFVALFKDEEDRDRHSHIYSMGFYLSLIKGNEAEIHFRDICYISFNPKIHFPSFAKAKNLLRTIEVGVCSSLACLNEENFVLDTDLEVAEDTLNFKLSIFPDLECHDFHVKEMKTGAAVFPMALSYEMNYPFPSPWDDESNNTIHKDTVETWISLNIDLFTKKQGNIFIVTQNLEAISDLYISGYHSLYYFKIHRMIDERACEMILVQKPEFIFFEYSTEGESNINELSSLVDFIKQQDGFQPFIIVTNNKTVSVGLQKALGYSFILGSPGQFSPEVFKLLTEVYYKKKEKQLRLFNQNFFSFSDNRRVIHLCTPIIVSSLTEHEITFFCSSELLLFTVLHFTAPMDFYATVIPSNEKLQLKEGLTHYSAFIHGLSENELMKLRQFVNQLIYDPSFPFSIENMGAITLKPQIEPRDKEEVSNVLVLSKQEIDSETLKEINGALKAKVKQKAL